MRLSFLTACTWVCSAHSPQTRGPSAPGLDFSVGGCSGQPRATASLRLSFGVVSQVRNLVMNSFLWNPRCSISSKLPRAYFQKVPPPQLLYRPVSHRPALFNHGWISVRAGRRSSFSARGLVALLFSFFLKNYLFASFSYLLWAALGLPCCTWGFPAVARQGLLRSRGPSVQAPYCCGARTQLARGMHFPDQG